MKSKIAQRMSDEDVVERAKMIMILRKFNRWNDQRMARCFKVSTNNFWAIVKYINQNKWLLKK